MYPEAESGSRVSAGSKTSPGSPFCSEGSVRQILQKRLDAPQSRERLESLARIEDFAGFVVGGLFRAFNAVEVPGLLDAAKLTPALNAGGLPRVFDAVRFLRVLDARQFLRVLNAGRRSGILSAREFVDAPALARAGRFLGFRKLLDADVLIRFGKLLDVYLRIGLGLLVETVVFAV